MEKKVKNNVKVRAQVDKWLGHGSIPSRTSKVENRIAQIKTYIGGIHILFGLYNVDCEDVYDK